METSKTTLAMMFGLLFLFPSPDVVVTVVFLFHSIIISSSSHKRMVWLNEYMNTVQYRTDRKARRLAGQGLSYFFLYRLCPIRVLLVKRLWFMTVLCLYLRKTISTEQNTVPHDC